MRHGGGPMLHPERDDISSPAANTASVIEDWQVSPDQTIVFPPAQPSPALRCSIRRINIANSCTSNRLLHQLLLAQSLLIFHISLPLLDMICDFSLSLS
jgi:hypothetical protein